MTKPISERDEALFDRGFAEGRNVGLAENAALIARLRDIIHRDGDRLVQLHSTLNEIGAIQALIDEETESKNARIAGVLEKLRDAMTEGT